jgi:arsenical pump membrane protein
VLRNAALPVLLVGLAATGWRRLRPRVSLPVLTGLFLVAVSLGTLARLWSGPASLLTHLDGPGAAALGAVSSVAINNLPAASLLSARPPAHPLALLIGLNLGPNLAVTGSLSAYLWYQAARRLDARPSLRHLSALGLALTPITIAAALVTLALTDPGAL